MTEVAPTPRWWPRTPLTARKAELARMAGISRDNVYDLLNRLDRPLGG